MYSSLRHIFYWIFCLGFVAINKIMAYSDWPMWRYDHGRKACAEIPLPDNPVLLWTRQLDTPERCWPFQYEEYYSAGNPDKIGKLSFDLSYEPIIGEGILFIPSMVSDKVTAYSALEGEELWSFYVGGPVRFAPVYNSGKVYFVSDDGYLYCLDAKSGKLLWNYHGSYSERMVLGNERLISMWPARGGPVFKDGIIYFASGVIPFEGVFIHAVDASNGKKIWTNSTTGSIWTLPQHPGTYSYAGPSPQGYLALSEDKLIVPGGRTPPAVFDLRTGDFLYFHQDHGVIGGGAGGYRSFTNNNWFFNHGMLYALEDGSQFGPVPCDVLSDNAFIGISGNKLIAHNSELKKIDTIIENRLARGELKKLFQIESIWEKQVPDLTRLYFKSKSHFVLGRNNGKTISLFKVNDKGIPDRLCWNYDIEGEIWNIIAGNACLYVVTLEGKIYCFGEGTGSSPKHYLYNNITYRPDIKSISLANTILQKTKGRNGGYALICGGDNYDLIHALSDNSTMHFIVAEPDPKIRENLRKRLDNNGLCGKRVAVVNASNMSSVFIPYIYDLIINTGNKHSKEESEKVFNSLRPYGGALCFIRTTNNSVKFLNQLNLANAELKKGNDFTIIIRKGPLPGSAQWTHQYGSSSNRAYSDDNLVKTPLGTVWFGGPSNEHILPRHHMGPIPQVAGGRLIIMGVETISARCVYTGRELWVREIPGIGHPYTSLEHEEIFRNNRSVSIGVRPGANFLGSPFVSTEEIIYVCDREKILLLDASNGSCIKELRLTHPESGKPYIFSFLLVCGDYLITTAGPQIFDDAQPGSGKGNPWNATSSSTLMVIDRHSCNMIWKVDAKTGFRHNAIVAGNDKLFLIDGLSEELLTLLQRRGLKEEVNAELIAFDLSNGKKLWSFNDNVFGTWLGFYEDKNILIQGGRRILFAAWDARRNLYRGLPDEPAERIKAHNSLTGEVIWENKDQLYIGPLGLHPDMIIPGGAGQPALDPYTGKIIMRNHPVTSEPVPWDYHKFYGCGSMNCSKYLITYRSGTAGFNDLLNDGGTGNFAGFKSGCTNNLIIADGMLSAPDYTRTCTCSYPLQTSFGFTHMPGIGVEMWTMNKLEIGDDFIRSLGINFGAPGNRKEDGILWLEYPKQCDPGPDLPIEINSKSLEYYRNHITWMKNHDQNYDWVGSYGAKGIKSILIKLIPENFVTEVNYTVTLYFTEPDNISPGERVFDVFIQNKKVLDGFDIAKQAGGPGLILTREFRGVKVRDKLKIDFSESKNQAVIAGIKIVLEDSQLSSSY